MRNKIASLRWEKVPVEGYCRIQGWGGGDLSICQKMILCPALMKKCHNILILDFTFNNILQGVLVCAPILKIKKKIISDSLSPWNYFYKTMVLILSQFLNIKTMVLYSGGSINRESPVQVQIWGIQKWGFHLLGNEFVNSRVTHVVQCYSYDSWKLNPLTVFRCWLFKQWNYCATNGHKILICFCFQLSDCKYQICVY